MMSTRTLRACALIIAAIVFASFYVFSTGCANLERYADPVADASPEPDAPATPDSSSPNPDAPAGGDAGVEPPADCPPEPPPPPECTCDEDCDHGEVCRTAYDGDGECVKKCSCDDDCDQGQKCLFGACRASY